MSKSNGLSKKPHVESVPVARFRKRLPAACVAAIAPAVSLGAIPWISALSGFAIFAVVSFVGIWVSIIIHEMGHVIGAWIARCRIFEVKFGTDPRLVKWIGGTRLSISWFPNGAYVRAMPRDIRWYRSRTIFFTAFGPIFTLGYLAFLFWLWSRVQSFNTVELQPVNNAIYLLAILELGGLSGVLLPRKVQIEGEECGTDVLQMWQTIKARVPDRIQHDFQFGYAQFRFLSAEGKTRKAGLWARKLARLSTDDMSLAEQHAMAAVLVGIEQWEPAKLIAERILADSSVESDDPMRWEAGDTFASAVLYGNDRATMPRAIQLIESIINDFPEVITLKGTLGGLLFEIGKFDQAETILKDVIAKSTAAIDQGISSAYLSRIALSRGAHEEARQYADTAIKTAGEQTVVKRILGLVEPRG